ncbi:MAG: site-specific DNA-methyltransferase [Gammaproteobacteria bacterium]
MPRNDYHNWDKPALIAEIKALNKRKKYGLVWEDKPEDVAAQCREQLPVLKEIKVLAIRAADSALPENLLIEGDNYHALSVLNYTHARKIDVIYIDPPYNTGAKDWKYNNDFVDKNDGYRHSKWLSMMAKRLGLAKKLLKKNGVLVCTVDKHEQANLGILLHEIFPVHEIVCVTIVHNPGGIQGHNFSHTNEYAYFVHPSNGIHISTVERDDASSFSFRDWGKETSKRESAKTCFYPIYVKDGVITGFGDVCADDFHPEGANVKGQSGVLEIYPVDGSGVERKWRFGRNRVEEIQHELTCKQVKGELVIIRDKRKYRWKTVWDENIYNANVYGTKLLNKLIGNDFPYPKSLYAVMDCIRAIIHNRQNAVILDFFAGSGTTGHAVSLLNRYDGGKRRFILCTNNENGIAREVCQPRIKAITQKHEAYPDITGIPLNLRYFKTAFVPALPTDKNKARLTRKATEMLCMREGTYEKERDNSDYKIFRNEKRRTGIIYNYAAIGKFKKAAAKLGGKFSVYVFSFGDEDFSESFADMRGVVKSRPIPEAILRVYRRIFK